MFSCGVQYLAPNGTEAASNVVSCQVYGVRHIICPSGKDERPSATTIYLRHGIYFAFAPMTLRFRLRFYRTFRSDLTRGFSTAMFQEDDVYCLGDYSFSHLSLAILQALYLSVRGSPSHLPRKDWSILYGQSLLVHN